MDTQDVTSTASSAASQEPDATAQVTSTEQAAQDDRPLVNALGEYNRKFTGLKQQLDTVMQYITATAGQLQQPQPAASAPKEITDDDLWGLAQQGDRQAFELYQQRIADKRIQAALGGQQRSNLVTAQLSALVAKYPVLNDNSHPLTQTVQQAFRLLVQQGYTNDQATLLEAAKTAIADRPDLVSDLYTQGAQVRDQQRRSATTRAQSGVTGASHRHDAAPPRTKVLSPEKTALAKRMGIKDPLASEARFLKRQEDGQSSLGGVSAFVREEDI